MGLVGVSLLLESCGSSLPVFKTTSESKLLVIPANKFSGQNNLLIVRSATLENDILLVKRNNAYKALYMKCTHEGFGLSATDKKIVCSAHGSIFDFDGNVIKEPALRPLKEFKTELNDDNIIIHLN